MLERGLLFFLLCIAFFGLAPATDVDQLRAVISNIHLPCNCEERILSSASGDQSSIECGPVSMKPAWENGRLVRLTLTGRGYEAPLTHLFLYSDKRILHIREGSLTGDHPEGGERYETEFLFDACDQLQTIREQNGRIRFFRYTAATAIIYDHGPTWHLRSESAYDGTYEALDDATLEKAATWRLWWRHGEEEACGGLDAKSGKELLLRREESPNRVRVRLETPDQAVAFLSYLSTLLTPPLLSEKGAAFGDLPGLLSTRKEISPDEVGGACFLRRTLDGYPRQVQYKDGRCELFDRDGLGRVVAMSTWEKGGREPQVVRFSYDGPHVTRIETDDETTVLSLDEFRRTTQIDKHGKLHEQYTLEYDAFDRIVSLRFEGAIKVCVRQVFSLDGGCERWLEMGENATFVATFDANGHLIRYERVTQSGRQTLLQNTFSSKDGQVEVDTQFGDHSHVSEAFSDNARRIWFDSKGNPCLDERFIPLDDQGSMRLVQTADVSRTVEWQVEGGRVKHVKGAGGFEVSYAYDEHGRLATKITGAGRQVHFVWDGAGHLVRLYSEDGSIDYRYSFDGAGRIVEAKDEVAQKKVVRAFDEAGRLIHDGECVASYNPDGGLKTVQILDETFHLTKREVTCRDMVWTFPPSPENSSRKNTTKQDGLGLYTQKAAFDGLNQLAGESGEYAEAYTFDPLGTLSSLNGTPCQYDANHRVIKIGESHFSYDADGLLIEKQDAKGRVTYAYDALGRLCEVIQQGKKMTYRYDGFGRMRERGAQQVVWFGDVEVALTSPKHTTIKVFHPLSRFCVGMVRDGKPYRAVTDCCGSLTALYEGSSLVEVYRYSAFGSNHIYNAKGERLLQGLCPWRYCGKRWMEREQLYDFGVRRYNPLLKRWVERDPLGLVDSVDDQVFVHNNPIDFVDPTGMFAVPFSFASIQRSVREACSHVSASILKTITNAKPKSAWLDDMRFGFEDTVCEFIGRSWMRLVGYNLDKTKIDTLGKGHEASRVRLTYINGFLNTAREIRSSVSSISKTHGNVPVHFVYVATEGFSGDLLRAAGSMAGRQSYPVQLLVKLWKELITELGGVKGGGAIIHYAHSLGATDTSTALRLLTLDERKMIRVSTFGAPTLLSEDLCGQVDNYVSTNDGVPLIDFFRYYRGGPNIHFIPSAYPGGLLPVTDHLFTGKTYGKVVEELGQKFQEQFLAH